MSKQVTVIVEGKEYVVEVGDLNARPIRARVGQKTYEVQVPKQEVKAAPAEKPAAAAAPVARTTAPQPQVASGSAISSPMPGDIIEVNVKPGDSVSPGDVVCVLEAMKMKNLIRTPRAGVVAEVFVSTGQAVMHGETLITFE